MPVGLLGLATNTTRLVRNAGKNSVYIRAILSLSAATTGIAPTRRTAIS